MPYGALRAGLRRPSYSSYLRTLSPAPPMEWLEPLLPLLIFAIYFLIQLGKRRGADRRPAPQPSEPASEAAPRVATTRAPTPFEELIRQIQQAAEETQRARQPAPPPPPEPPRPARTLAPRRPPPARPASPEFHAVGGFEHERHGFDPASPFSEEAFQHLARGADVTTHAPGHLDHDPHGLRSPTDSERRAHPLVARLRNSRTAREAFALRAVLGAPRARRRRP